MSDNTHELRDIFLDVAEEETLTDKPSNPPGNQSGSTTPNSRRQPRRSPGTTASRRQSTAPKSAARRSRPGRPPRDGRVQCLDRQRNPAVAVV